MNKAKKLACLILMMIMALTMTVSASAASITINGTETAGHTYNVYQIYTGDETEVTENSTTTKVLSNIKYGQNYVPSGKSVGDAVPDSEIESLKKDGADVFAKDLIANNGLTGAPIKVLNAANSYAAEELADGYYLIQDVTADVPAGDSVSAYMVQALGTVSITPKSGVVTVEKKVDDKNDSNESEDAIEWQDSADYDIGDDVPFQITATLPENVTAYSSYKLILHDTMSKGLTYNTSTINVTLKNVNDNNATIVNSQHYAVGYTTNTDGSSNLTITFDNVKAFGAGDNAVITVEYTAELNSNAVIGSAGNPNEVYGEYSNNPNSDGTGETVKDTVIVFTYQLVVNKVDKDNKSLAGAGFTLYKWVEKVTEDADTKAYDWQAIGSELKDTEMVTFTWTGLDDGTYKLEETTTPAGYNTIDPIEFKIVAGHVAESDAPTLTSLTGDVTSGTATFTADVTAGSLTTNIVNQAGVELPTTGGVGTTVFYLCGGMMALAAVLLQMGKSRKAYK